MRSAMGPREWEAVMTDLPRFQIAKGDPDECYRQYHGAALVAWVFSGADCWLSRRSRERFAACASTPQATSDQPYPSLAENAP